MKKTVLYETYKFFHKIGYIRKRNKSNQSMTILMYHRVNDYDDNRLSLNTEIFKQVVDLLSLKYNVISLGEVIRKIKQQEPFHHREVAITFDDGYLDNYLNAFPILAEKKMPACFFVTSGYIGTNRTFPWDKNNANIFDMMTWEQVKELSEHGFDIGAHTVDHLDLGKVSLSETKKQVEDSKKNIEKNINTDVNYFSYPFGGISNLRKETPKVVKEAGFTCCCSGFGGKVNKSSDLFALNRVGSYPNCLEMEMELQNFMVYLDGTMTINLPLLNILAQVMRKS